MSSREKCQYKVPNQRACWSYASSGDSYCEFHRVAKYSAVKLSETDKEKKENV